VARALSCLRKEGAISTEGSRVTILSLGKLEDVASGEERGA
jgi:hypothetical protein